MPHSLREGFIPNEIRPLFSGKAAFYFVWNRRGDG